MMQMMLMSQMFGGGDSDDMFNGLFNEIDSNIDGLEDISDITVEDMQ